MQREKEFHEIKYHDMPDKSNEVLLVISIETEMLTH